MNATANPWTGVAQILVGPPDVVAGLRESLDEWTATLPALCQSHGRVVIGGQWCENSYATEHWGNPWLTYVGQHANGDVCIERWAYVMPCGLICQIET